MPFTVDVRDLTTLVAGTGALTLLLRNDHERRMLMRARREEALTDLLAAFHALHGASAHRFLRRAQSVEIPAEDGDALIKLDMALLHAVARWTVIAGPYSQLRLSILDARAAYVAANAEIANYMHPDTVDAALANATSGPPEFPKDLHDGVYMNAYREGRSWADRCARWPSDQLKRRKAERTTYAGSATLKAAFAASDALREGRIQKMAENREC